MSLSINGIGYDYKLGHEITDEFDNKLGSGFVILPREVEIDIEPLDPVIINGVYRRVLNYRRKIIRFKPSKLYRYEIQLVTPEIMLQRIILPNRSVTQPVTGTKKTIYDVLNRYRILYASHLSWASGLSTLLNVECPEKQWAQPTFYEVLTDLFEVVGLSVKMYNFTTISYLDLNARGDEINEDYLTDEEVTHTANEYASELDVDLKNAIPDGINIRSFQAPKTLDGSLLTTTNGQIILEDNIEQIDNVTARYVREDGGVAYLCTVDITSQIVEKKVYDSLYPSNNATYISLSGNYKRNYLYYTQGSNTIDGLYYTDSSWFSITPPRSLDNILYGKLASTQKVAITGSWSGTLRDVVFYITYKTISDVKMRVFKSSNIRNSNVLINGQEESYISQPRFSKAQRELLNRIGNAEHILYGKYNNIADIPSVGDTYGDYVVTTRTYKSEDTFYTASMTLTKDLVKKHLYQGLNTRKRFTEYAGQREAFYSNHVHKIRYRFGFTNSLTADEFSISTLNTYQLGTGFTDKPYVYFRTYGAADVAISDWVRFNGKTFKHNKSIVYHFQMFNNIAIAPSVDSDYNASYIKYVDDLGEFQSYDVRMFAGETYFDFLGTPPAPYENPPTSVAEFYNQVNSIRDIRNFYAISGFDEFYAPYEMFRSDKVLRYKDNREITSETLMMIFEDTTNIFIYDKFAELHPMGRYVNEGKTNFKLYISTTQIYDKNSIIGVGTAYDNTNISITDNSLNVIPSLTGAMSWGITDENDNILIGVNSANSTIYLGRVDS